MTVKCEICSIHNAKYVCQNCGSRVCPSCFNQWLELCVKCTVSSPSGVELKYGIGFKIMAIGFVLVFVGILITAALAILTGVGNLSFVILLLPIPVGVAVGPYGGILLLFTLIVTLLFMIILILNSRRHLRQFSSREASEGV